MPRNALVWLLLVGGCSIHADYTGGHYQCSDGVCPAGLSCHANACVAIDAGSAADAARADATIDGRPAALTCADPGTPPSSDGTTVGRSNTVSSLCGGLVMNGADAVFRVPATLGQTIHVTITGSYPVKAYVIAPCTLAPATPACVGNVAAIAGAPLAVAAPFAGTFYVVVDDENPALTGTYALAVTVN